MKEKQFLAGCIMALTGAMTQAMPVVTQAVIDGGFGSLSAPGQQIADNFSLNQEYSITGLKWWGSYLSDNTGDDFTVRLFDDDGGDPQTVPGILDVGVTATRSVLLGVTDFLGEQMYEYDIALSFLLGPGDYFLSILNDADDAWYWADGSSGDDQNWFRTDDNVGWIAPDDPFYDDPNNFPYDPYDLAFEITGDATGTQIPVPGSLVLLLTGFAGLRLHRLTAKKK